MRTTIILLGDQLNTASAALDNFEPHHDATRMPEVAQKGSEVWSRKPCTICEDFGDIELLFEYQTVLGPTAGLTCAAPPDPNLELEPAR